MRFAQAIERLPLDVQPLVDLAVAAMIQTGHLPLIVVRAPGGNVAMPGNFQDDGEKRFWLANVTDVILACEGDGYGFAMRAWTVLEDNPENPSQLPPRLDPRGRTSFVFGGVSPQGVKAHILMSEDGEVQDVSASPESRFVGDLFNLMPTDRGPSAVLAARDRIGIRRRQGILSLDPEEVS